MGQLLDIYVEMILDSDVLVSDFLSSRGMSSIQLLSQNELEVVASGVLDGYYFNRNNPNVLLLEQDTDSHPLVQRSRVAIIVALSWESVCEALRNEQDNSFLSLLRQTLLHLQPFWPMVSMYVGFENIRGTVDRSCSENLTRDIESYLFQLLISVCPLSNFNSLNFQAVASTNDDGNRSKEIAKLHTICKLGELASETVHDYYVFLPEKIPHFRENRVSYNIFSRLEYIVMNNHLGKDKSALKVWNEISHTCARSYQHIAACQTDVSSLCLSSFMSLLFTHELFMYIIVSVLSLDNINMFHV